MAVSAPPTTLTNVGSYFLNEIIAADFNGDGKTDLAVTDGSAGTVIIYLGNGAGGFGSRASYSTNGSDPFGIVAGDFNGDGKIDLAVTNAL